MQSEQDWAERIDADEDYGAAERYLYFMRPEPKEHLGPIYTIDDPWLGQETQVRDMRIGMVRNAKDEDRKDVQVFLQPFPHMRLSKAKDLQGWYQSKHNIYPDTGRAHRPRPCWTEAILTEPYGGFCGISCCFCYVNSGMRGYRGTGLTTVPINYGEQVAEQLKKMRRSAAGYFSSFIDPFLPLEDYYHNTEEAANEFVKVGLPLFFLSRLRYPDWAVELLKQNKHSYAQKSLNTGNDEDWQKLSPGAITLEAHLRDIRRLKKHGIYVSIQCNPIVPGVTNHEDILLLFRKLAEAGVDHVIVKFVEAGYSWAPAMVERMIKRFGNRGREFATMFTENMGGQRCVQEEYRLQAHKIYSAQAEKLGLTYSTCYEYEYARTATGAIIDKTGISIAKKFTTSAQCHGPAVPIYTRELVEETFVPVEECPPSGCLHCADENTDNPGTSRCGDELAGQAAALKLNDFKQPIGKGVPKQLIQLVMLKRVKE